MDVTFTLRSCLLSFIFAVPLLVPDQIPPSLWRRAAK